MDEEKVIERLSEGSEQALGIAYDMYARQLLSYAFSYTKSKEDSEEIVQDAFLSLWTHRGSLRNRESLRPFLFTSVRHRIIDLLRQRVKSVVFEDYMLSSDSLSMQDGGVDFDEYMSIVRRSMSQLPPAQRRILQLSKFEGKSNREIAEALSLSEKTVKNQLSLGNKALREAIKCFLTIVGVFYILSRVPFALVSRLF